MIMNGIVQHATIHLSDTHWRFIKPHKRVVRQGLNSGRTMCLYLDAAAPKGAGAKRDLGCHALSDMSSWPQP